jgi:hypothetical protein
MDVNLNLPVQVRQQTGTTRSWRTLWRTRPVHRVVFAGYIESYSLSLNGFATMDLVDDMATRLRRTWVS